MAAMSNPAPSFHRDVLRFIEDEAARDALLRVFGEARRITDNATDKKIVVMLVSRRLACLYEMLVASGDIERFDPAHFEVVSDRVLDADRDKWTGRRAVLIDDVMNLGSSLTRRYDELRELVGDQSVINVLVALRDKGRSSPAFVEHLDIRPEAEGGPLERSDKELDELALQMATCLYRSLMPYFTDFPILKLIDVKSAVLDELLSTQRWMVADVTAPISGEGQRAYTLVPTADTERLIRSKADAAAMELAELLKVRLYTAEPEAGVRWLRIVPIGVPGAVMPTELDSTLGTLADELHSIGDTSLRWDRWKPRAKHRLLQMYISACVAAEFWRDLEEVGAVDEEFGKDHIEDGHLHSYFGPDFEGVLGAFRHAVTLYRGAAGSGPAARSRFPFEPESSLWRKEAVRETAYLMRDLINDANGRGDISVEPPAPPPGGRTRFGEHMIWVQRVLSVFGVIDAKLEKYQAKKLSELTYEQFEIYRADETFEGLGQRVMDQGVRLSELAKVVTGTASHDDVWRRALPSLALDIGNDLGVAVPTTTDNGQNQPVFRQYRSGEGAFLANMPHNRLRNVTRENASSHLDFLTKYALKEGLSAGTTDTDWALDEADRIRKLIPDDCLLQRWVGQVIEVEDGLFTADFVTTIGGQDVERATFRAEETLNESDQKNLGVDAIVEWLVYGPEDTASEGTSRVVRVTHPAAVTRD